MKLKEKISNIQNSITVKTKKDVDILFVSKKATLSQIKEVFELGFSHFGENYIQDWLEKKEKLPEEICWHFIGKIQTNKIKHLVGKVYLIHSLYELHHAQKISQISLEKNIKQDVLVQINVAKEKTKSGCDLEEALNTCKEINSLEGICLRGLMAFPPQTKDEKIIASYFKKMNDLFNELKFLNSNFNILSMGTSQDYQLAIENNSNLIRLGSLIFQD